MLVLDGTPQITTKDGFIYNETITHIAMTTHPAPARTAMIGGGDCGPASEALRYDTVEQVDIVEIDQRVVEVCRTWMPHAAAVEADERVRLVLRTASAGFRAARERSDVLLIGRSDSYGPATPLYKPVFYQYVHDSLREDGIAVIQSGSPYYNAASLRSTVRSMKRLFPVVRVYLCAIPSFPGGVWSFTIASKRWDPLEADLSRLRSEHAQYMNVQLFRSCFELPGYVSRILAPDSKDTADK